MNQFVNSRFEIRDSKSGRFEIRDSKLSPISDTLEFLYGLQSFGIKLGLENIRALLTELGNPQLAYPAVHVAGTNGKGSTSAMIAATLTASGYRTGLYTSPHLVRFNERIRIDGGDIPDEVLVRYTEILKPLITSRKATFFEATTAIAFAWFAERKVDAAVVEVGLGGLYDATNVLTPAVSVITNIGLDHTEYLGNTIEEIAAQKGGIIKNRVPVVLGNLPSEAAQVCKRIADRHNAPCIAIPKDAQVEIIAEELSGLTLNIQTRGFRLARLNVSLPGRQQSSNAATALLALDTLRSSAGFNRISDRSIRDGFGTIQSLTGLRGRIDVIASHPLTIGDVAHNPQAIANLVGELPRLIPGRCITVFGVMADKDYESILKELSTISRLIIAVQPETERALSVEKLCDSAHGAGISCQIGRSVAAGLNLAHQECRTGEYILITGSHYVLGEAIPLL